MTDIQVRLRIEDEGDLEAAYASAEATPDLEVREITPPSEGIEPQVEPITAVLIGAGVLAVVKFVTDWWEKRRGGLVIDQRADAKDDIYHDKDLPYGYVLVFPRDGGTVKIEVKDAPKDAIERLLAAVITGAFKSVSDLAKAATEAVGGGKVQEQPAGA